MSFTYEAGLPVELAYAAEQVVAAFVKGLPATATTPNTPFRSSAQLLTDSCLVLRRRQYAQEVLAEARHRMEDRIAVR